MMTSLYRPLQQREIRVLELISSNEYAFKVVHIQLDKNPKFAALSYCWGETNLRHEIKVNGKPFSVTQNLHDVLRQFWRGVNHPSQRKPLDFHIWIDAISINQDDQKEKSSQIQLMVEIFDRATFIYVWLGHPRDEECNKLAIILMQQLRKRHLAALKASFKIRPWWWPKQVYQGEAVDNRFLASLSESDKSIIDVTGSSAQKAWLGIQAILGSPWWHRTWILQEATISEDTDKVYIMGIPINEPVSKVVLVSGNEVTSLAHLSSAMCAAGRFRKTSLFDFEPIFLATHATSKVYSVSQYRAKTQYGREPGTFLELLQQFRQSSCSNPLDKIFAPLCLAPDLVRHQFVPDYSMTPLDLHLKLAKYLLQQSGHEFDLFGYAMTLNGHPCHPIDGIEEEEWPSWVPNWNKSLWLHPLPKVLNVQHDPRRRTIRPIDLTLKYGNTAYRTNVYNATQGLAALDLHVDNAQLRVKGIRLDDIVDVVAFSSGIPAVNQKLTAWLTKTNPPGKYLTGEPFQVAIDRTQSADVVHSSFGFVIGRNGSVNNKLLKRPAYELTEAEQAEQSSMSLSLKRATASRGLCLTQGGFLGLVPESSKAGDQICAFLGSQVLYVLRPRISYDTFIGESYVHGMMDGEILYRFRKGDCTISDIILR